MNLYLTKKLNDKLKIELKPEQPIDGLYKWRANYIQEQGQRFVVFMNDASKFTIVINEVKVAKLKKLSLLFIETLRATLLAISINPDVVDRYAKELGEITYIKNSDRRKTAWLNKCTEAAWWSLTKFSGDVDLSIYANEYLHGSVLENDKDYSTPKENIVNLLGVYGMPVLKLQAYDLNIRLDLFDKEVIRCLRVPANISFDELHKLLQIAFGWRNYHLYSFGMFKEWSENRYATPELELFLDEGSLEMNPCGQLVQGKRLSDYVNEYRKFLYTYDFGDNWQHYIEVENIIEDCEDKLPILLSGEGDAPPEDVGGAGGFANFLEIMSDPNHDEYKHMSTWSKSLGWKPFNFEQTARIISNQR